MPRLRLPATFLALASLILASCERSDRDKTPEAAVQYWILQMDLSSENRAAMREAYSVMGPTARANLEERATRTSQLHGRRVEAHDMLGEGWFGLRFQPRSFRSTVVGDIATVEILGADPSAEKASVRCVRENSKWRIEPELPEPPLLPKRDGG